MKSCMTCLFLVVLILLPLNVYAEVGVIQKTFTDEQRGRELVTHIWYPCENQETCLVADNVVFKGFNAVQNGVIKNGKFPLYILLHGTTGNWKNLSWLAARLTEGGAIAAAANHPGYTSGNATPATVLRMWDQPTDASFLLDQLLASKFGRNIDKKRIFVVGYSLGGYSAMALAGAELDMKQYVNYCLKNDDESCRYFKPAFAELTASFYKKSSGNHLDQRIAGCIAIAPGFVLSMTDKSLANIKIPTLVIGAESDKNIPPKTQLYPKVKSFSKAVHYKEIKDASHFSFMQLCKPNASVILAEEKAEFVCIDGAVKDRKAIHDELFRLITDFAKNIVK